MPDQLAEGRVGVARAADEVLVGAVVARARHAARLAELVDLSPDLTARDVHVRRRLAQHLVLDELVEGEPLQVLGDGSLLHRVKGRVLLHAGELEFADRLPVDQERGLPALRPLVAAEERPRRKGDDHADEQPDGDDPQNNGVGSFA